MAYDKQVLAFHYVWYGTPWGPAGQWRGWKNEAYDADRVFNGRRNVTVAHYPLDGVYDSLSEDTIRRQLQEAELAQIDGFILSWWGIGDYSDQVLDRFMALAPESFVTIYYETAMTFKLRDQSREQAIQRITEDLKDLLERYKDNPRWIKVEGKPLFVLYIVANYSVEEWQRIKGEVEQAYGPVFFLGDTYNLDYLQVMDGLHTYNPIGITLRGDSLEETYTRVAEDCHKQGKLFAGTACPGYDDRKIRTPGLYVAREDGGYYERSWSACRRSGADWVLICSYNEWYEGSEIEPSQEYGLEYLYLTRQNARTFKK